MYCNAGLPLPQELVQQMECEEDNLSFTNLTPDEQWTDNDDAMSHMPAVLKMLVMLLVHTCGAPCTWGDCAV